MRTGLKIRNYFVSSLRLALQVFDAGFQILNEFFWKEVLELVGH